jgi:hypothetical protein
MSGPRLIDLLGYCYTLAASNTQERGELGCDLGNSVLEHIHERTGESRDVLSEAAERRSYCRPLEGFAGGLPGLDPADLRCADLSRLFRTFGELDAQGFTRDLTAYLLDSIKDRSGPEADRVRWFFKELLAGRTWPRFPPVFGATAAKPALSSGRQTGEQPPAPPAALTETAPLVPALEVIPGGIRYDQVTVDLSGKALACIRELLDAHGHRLDWTKLQDRVWGQDSYTGQATIKNTIADARDALRKLARQAGKRINEDFDPLPCVGRGKELAWKLDFPE